MGLPGLRTHRKFRRLVALLRIPEAHALGHLQMMWETSWDHLSPALGDATDVDLSAGWVGEPSALAEALVACGGDEPGFLEHGEDGRYVIHDWLEHAPRWVREKVRKREGLAAEGKTISDVKRQAGMAGASARWKDRTPKNGKAALVCHENDGTCQGKDGEKCPSPPLPSLPLKPEDSKESSPKTGKADRVVETWNQATTGKLPKAKLTPKRSATILRLLREPGWLEDFTTACTFLTTSPWHLGQNDRGWVATIDFLLQAGKATELAEKAAAPKPPAHTPGAPNGSRSPQHRAGVDAAYIQTLAERPARRIESVADDPELRSLFEADANP